MNRIYFLSIFIFSTHLLAAQNKQDIKGIQALCGCFEVTFMYAETFSTDTAYKFDKRYHARGLEYIVAEEATPSRFVLQHLLVKALNKTDLAAVTIADTTGVYLDHDITDATTVSLVDYWDGDLKKTAISEIAVNENDNKVYLLSFEGSKTQDQYYKIKITRNGTSYRLRYARIGDSDIKTLDVPKGTETNFQFASIETGKLVSAEPKKQAWDIAWCYGTYNSGLGSPYWFQDFVISNNLAGTAVAEVLETQVSYDTFSASNIATAGFLTTRDAIGSKWRQGGGPSVPGTIKRDRYYAVKDPTGNVYKLKFISWGGGGDAGERGRPVIEYKLVKRHRLRIGKTESTATHQ